MWHPNRNLWHRPLTILNKAGGAGADYIDGGPGNDVAVYSGAFADYALSKDGIYWVLADQRIGGDDTDYLINVETLRFIDRDASLTGLVLGTGGAEVLRGSSGNDTIYGRAGNDDLYGMEGDDTLIGGAGADYIDDGSGNDIAVYSGEFADYSLSKAGIYWVVADQRAGGDDADYLINVESLRFSDGVVAINADGISSFDSNPPAEVVYYSDWFY